MGEGEVPRDPRQVRLALLEELRAVEAQWQRVRAGLVELGPGAPLPGLYLRVRAAGGHVLVAAARIAEIARVVAFEPVPGSPTWCRGAFVWRGAPALAVDLGARLGAAPCTSLDAVMVILEGVPTVALLVDEVRNLVEDPLLGDGGGEPSGASVFLGTCRADGEAVPLLAIEALEREVKGFT
jgi:purine-binding chemotaxis protein CheW